MHQGTKIPGSASSAEPTHCVYYAENANHNSRTLDRRNIFYGLGIICSVTPPVSSSFAILRLEDMSTEDLIRLAEEIERKILPSSRTPLRIKFIELNEPVNAFDPPRSTWAATCLLSP